MFDNFHLLCLNRHLGSEHYSYGEYDEDGNGHDDDTGLLPETYSDPDFRGASNVEFEGDRKPSFDGTATGTGNDKLDMKHLPNLKPDERSGTVFPDRPTNLT